jgi:endonuclease/exonuclease/phosphatase (EEP) superfamily protein YafD
MRASMTDSSPPSGAVASKTRHLRTIEFAAAWVAVAVAWCAAALGLVGPLLGGPGPGLPGPIGFASETVAAMWFQGGVLAAIVAVAAALRRLWRPAAALAPVVLVTLGPELWARAWSPARGLRADSPALRIATVNLQAENDEDPFMVESLRRIDADVLVLPEFTPSWAERLEPSFSGDYPHRWLAAPRVREGWRTEGLRLAVWSRVPAAGPHEVLDLREWVQLRVPLRWRDRDFVLYGVHLRKPFPYGLHASAWRDRQVLLDRLRAERLPIVVAGDFNAPPRSAFVRRLRGLALTSAAEAVCGSAPATWPMHPWRLAPFRVAIDHVLCGDAFEAVGFGLGMTTGSDHAPVFAELAWRHD